jgi:hypothetical protein
MNSARTFLSAAGLLVLAFVLYVSAPLVRSLMTPPDDDSGTVLANQSPAIAAPRVVSKTVSFMPGEAVNIPNSQFKKVEIHSQFPIRVLTGNCHVDYTVEFFCNQGPNEVFISDMRQKPIFTAPQGNFVSITFTEY